MTRQSAHASHLRLVTAEPPATKVKKSVADPLIDEIMLILARAELAADEISDGLVALNVSISARDRDAVVAGLRRIVALSALAQRAANGLEELPL